MIKYLSYANLFIGVIFIAILKSNNNYLDMALIIPAVVFNWLTLFHFIKNDFPFQKWHLGVGFLSIFFSIISTAITIQILFGTYNSNNILLGPSFYTTVLRQIFEFFIIFQFIVAFKANKKMNKLN